MNDFDRAIAHARFVAGTGDLRATESAFEDAVALALARGAGDAPAPAPAPANAHAGAGAAPHAAEALWDLALHVADALGTPEPVGWATVASGRLGVAHPARALDAIRAARARRRGFGARFVDRYAVDLGALADAQDAAARSAPIEGGGRDAFRRRADALRGAVWEAREAYGHASPRLDRFVPAVFPEIARGVVRRARAVAKDPGDEAALTGSGMPDDDVLWPLYAPRPQAGDVLPRPPSLKTALVLLAIADELAADGDVEGARWAVSLGAMIPAGIRTIDPDPREGVAEVVMAMADAARRYGVLGLAKPLRGIARVHDCDEDLSEPALRAIASLEAGEAASRQ